jgi:hypothetical protein
MPTSAILAIAASRDKQVNVAVDHALKVRELRLVQCSNHVRRKGSSTVDLHRSIPRQLYPPIAVAIAATAKMPFVCHYRSFRWISIRVLVANGQRPCPPRFGLRFDFCRPGIPFDEIINVPESGSKKIKETDVLGNYSPLRRCDSPMRH